MELAALYYPIYLLVVAVLTLAVYGRYRLRPAGTELSAAYANAPFCLMLAVAMAFFIGLRPESGRYFGDMANYVLSYHLSYENVPFRFNPDAQNPIWDNWWAFWGSQNLGTTTFFVASATVYFVCTFIACRKWFPKDTYVAYLVFLAAFSTFSYTTNGCKAGNAASVFLVAMAYRDKWYVWLPLLAVSLGLHHSMKLPIAVFVATVVYRNPKVYFAAWCLCVLLSLAHVTWFQALFAQISTDAGDHGGTEYLTGSSSSEWGGKSGFRYDFVLYSAMPVLVGYYAIFKKRMRSVAYSSLLNCYMALNAVWMLCMYAPFTNRIAYLSWFMYPFVLIYPFLCENWGAAKYRTFSKVMMWHLAFTLFMQLVFYKV